MNVLMTEILPIILSERTDQTHPGAVPLSPEVASSRIPSAARSNFTETREFQSR
jgi:hypothetical protein